MDLLRSWLKRKKIYWDHTITSYFKAYIDMNELKHNLLLHLADHTQVMELALEGNDLDFDERLRYLGHLAMCARFFKSIYLDETAESLERYFSIENSSFRFNPADERGAIAKESWNELSKILQHYIVALKIK